MCSDSYGLVQFAESEVQMLCNKALKLWSSAEIHRTSCNLVMGHWDGTSFCPDQSLSHSFPEV
eukprot:6480297-Amphidinium_carterae.2